MNAFEAAEKNGRAADLQKELEDLFNSQNKSPRKDATSIPATFLRVTVALSLSAWFLRHPSYNSVSSRHWQTVRMSPRLCVTVTGHPDQAAAACRLR